MTTELITTAEAAKRIGCTQQWIQALIGRGDLKAQKFGKMFMLKASDVDNYERVPLGRPPTKKPSRNGKRKVKR